MSEEPDQGMYLGAARVTPELIGTLGEMGVVAMELDIPLVIPPIMYMNLYAILGMVDPDSVDPEELAMRGYIMQCFEEAMRVSLAHRPALLARWLDLRSNLVGGVLGEMMRDDG